ncbi:MAG: hypothetical protein AAF235_10375, partial [Planctomycetota bacterium]
MVHSRAQSREGSTQQSKDRASPVVAVSLTALAAVFVIAAWLALRPPPTESPSDTLAEDDIPTITLGGSSVGSGESGENMRIQIADADDPTKTAGEILVARFEPITPTSRRVEEPVAWFFLEDGKTLHIRADKGRFDIPPGQREPNRGRLEGGVRIRLFDPLPSGGRPAPDTAAPALDASTALPLDFDLVF